MEELEQMLCNYCQLPAAGGVENGYGKVNILLQTYIDRGEVDSFSLISDLSYVAQVRTARRGAAGRCCWSARIAFIHLLYTQSDPCCGIYCHTNSNDFKSLKILGILMETKRGGAKVRRWKK